MKDLINLVTKWAEDRNLVKGATPKDQYMKLIQECGELSDSICKGKDASDDIGDCTVVLIILAAQLGLDFEKCLETAYNDIKYRKGAMIDGVFVKSADLTDVAI
jgi:predicted DsbA family dithiol-disulfide isomerase